MPAPPAPVPQQSAGYMPTLLQLTDLHLFADRATILKGVNPWESLGCVLETIRRRQIEFDHLVLTGDLTHDGLPQTYEHLREALDEWVHRAWLIPGNHDDRSLVGQCSMVVRLATESRTTSDRVTFSCTAGNWRIIGLDTLVPGELRGEIGDEQLAWLASQLAEHGPSPTLIFMHHPPVDVGSAWLDRIGLTDRKAFCHLIESSPHVRLICCGHIHQEFEGRLGAATVLAAPSTSVQFQPCTETLVVADLPPGFRLLRLSDSGFETHIVRATA